MAQTLKLFVKLLLVASTAFAACTDPGKRKAWHTLSDPEKLEYINAELCLMNKPAALGLPGAKTRFDELQAIHQLQAYSTHFVGSFLPFHRLMMHAHESALRTECNYTGYQPYWQEQLDAGNFRSSVLFDPVYGFGGDGSGAGGCITTGPFANYTNSLGPGYEITDHCINRRINDFMSRGSSQAQVDRCLAAEDFDTAWNCIEGQPHAGGHGGVGGQMMNGVSSPGDPLFYLHHTWLDKVFWDWQARDRAVRVANISGTNIGPDFAPGFPPRPSHIPKPTGADGDPGTTTTMGHVLNMYGNSPNKTIADVMDIQGDYLCYEYVEP
ncbi:Tyrosinase [Madurella mycetomatis]|uniref:Tyrosinase n=1 Tax=Madurella mycetomatis TaxID=100816 RepID=A0A175W2K8_9PEZI|nr:Tyrosinase [Madurella mycetomatis]